LIDAEASGAGPPDPGGGDSGITRQPGAVLASPAYSGNADGIGANLSNRLNAVARLVQIGAARVGQEGFDPRLLADAEALLARAGERLRLSAHHTIVVLAGGTGSGKSSLFNQLAGAPFSPVGVLRPVTRAPHACVWGMEGAGPLLDWLGIQPRHRYARSSALEEGERALTGLLLVDLPDHDSVVTGGSAEVTRLVTQADLMVWVLDPQKYADAAVHSRYLVPMAGHSSVIAAALNQADLLTPEQAEDCVADLRRLLDTEGLHDARVVLTSATSESGVADLRRALMETVIARQAALQRINADVDAVAARFAPYTADADALARVTAALGPGTAALDPASAALGPGSAAVSPGSAGVGPGSAAVSPGSAGVGPGSAAVSPGSAAVSPGSAGVGPGSAAVSPGSAGVGPGSAAVAAPDPGSAGGEPAGSAGQGDPPEQGSGAAAGAGAGPFPAADGFGTDGMPGAVTSALPAASTEALAAAFCAAAGVSGVGRALQSAREMKAVDYVGWPIAWLADRVTGRDPVRKNRLGTLWDELRDVSAGSSPAQQAEISNAITVLADEAGRGLPGTWQASVRQAARSNTADIPAALGNAIGEALPQENSAAPWWRAVAAWQGLLLGVAAVGVAWLLAIIILGAFGAAPGAPLLLRDVSLLPWVVLIVAAILLLGWLTANGSMAVVIRETDEGREQAEQRMRAGVADVARQFVVAPVERELYEFARFHEELAVARGAG
jgi:GTP-binding protein EngB required for normal cell division